MNTGEYLLKSYETLEGLLELAVKCSADETDKYRETTLAAQKLLNSLYKSLSGKKGAAIQAIAKCYLKISECIDNEELDFAIGAIGGVKCFISEAVAEMEKQDGPE
jgi:hypothetical protein